MGILNVWHNKLCVPPTGSLFFAWPWNCCRIPLKWRDSNDETPRGQYFEGDTADSKNHQNLLGQELNHQFHEGKTPTITEEYFMVYDQTNLWKIQFPNSQVTIALMWTTKTHEEPTHWVSPTCRPRFGRSIAPACLDGTELGKPWGYLRFLKPVQTKELFTCGWSVIYLWFMYVYLWFICGRSVVYDTRCSNAQNGGPMQMFDPKFMSIQWPRWFISPYTGALGQSSPSTSRAGDHPNSSTSLGYVHAG